jgi:preprotein translocase subunit YajC
MAGGLESLIFIVFLFAIFYFLLIRPQKKRVEQHRKLIESVDPGDEVITIGGLYGTVRAIGDDEMELEVAPGTTLKFTKSAIARRLTEDLEDSPEPEIEPAEETVGKTS